MHRDVLYSILTLHTDTQQQYCFSRIFWLVGKWLGVLSVLYAVVFFAVASDLQRHTRNLRSDSAVTLSWQLMDVFPLIWLFVGILSAA